MQLSRTGILHPNGGSGWVDDEASPATQRDLLRKTLQRCVAGKRTIVKVAVGWRMNDKPVPRAALATRCIPNPRSCGHQHRMDHGRSRAKIVPSRKLNIEITDGGCGRCRIPQMSVPTTFGVNAIEWKIELLGDDIGDMGRSALLQQH